MKGIENASDGGNGSRLSAWQTDNIVKIFPSDAPGPETEPYLELAGNEEEGMQLGIRGNSENSILNVMFPGETFTAPKVCTISSR